MRTKIFLFITFLTFLCDSSESVVVDCKFGNDLFLGYKCEVQNSELITSKDDREISEVRVEHKSGKSNDDVKYFYSASKKVSFFPIITKVFKNVDTVRIIYTKNLKEITREDLKQFNGKLKILWLEGDGIEVIEADLFEDNQNLELLDLNSNNIRHIEDGALTKLKKLSTFYFGGTSCKQLSTIEETEKACKDPNYVPRICKNSIIPLKNEISTLTQKFDSTLKDLNAQIKENKKLKAEKGKITEKNCQLESEKLKIVEKYQKLKVESEQEIETHDNIKRQQESKISQLESEKSKLSEENQNLKVFTKKLNETFEDTLKAFEANFTNFEVIKREQETKISSLEEKISKQKFECEAKVSKVEDEMLKIAEENRKLKAKIEQESKGFDQLLRAIEEKFFILSKIATKIEKVESNQQKVTKCDLAAIDAKIDQQNSNFATKLDQISPRFAAIESKIDQQSSNLIKIPTKVDENSKVLLEVMKQDLKAQDTKLESLAQIQSKLETLENKIDHQKVVKCDLAAIETKLDQQNSKFETKFDQIPSKIMDESKKNFQDLNKEQKNILESNFAKFIKFLKNLNQRVETMGDSMEAKIEAYCKRP